MNDRKGMMENKRLELKRHRGNFPAEVNQESDLNETRNDKRQRNSIQIDSLGWVMAHFAVGGGGKQR